MMYLARVSRTRSLCSSERRAPLALMDCHALSNAAVKILTVPGSKTSSPGKLRTSPPPMPRQCAGSRLAPRGSSRLCPQHASEDRPLMAARCEQDKTVPDCVVKAQAPPDMKQRAD